MFSINTEFAKYDDCVWNISGKGKYTRYEIFSVNDGPIMTVNLPGYGVSETVVAVKDYSENAGTMNFLKKHNLIKKSHGYKISGFVLLPIVELDLEKLKAM